MNTTYQRYNDEECIGYISESGEEHRETKVIESKPKFNSKKHWTKEEVLKFYKGISMYGIDLGVLEKYFNSTRTRKELKSKLKVEEKVRPEIVSKAMMSKQRMDEDFLSVVLNA
ncbi:Myb-like domain-containing protein [Entamoeba marina]